MEAGPHRCSSMLVNFHGITESPRPPVEKAGAHLLALANLTADPWLEIAELDFRQATCRRNQCRPIGAFTTYYEGQVAPMLQQLCHLRHYFTSLLIRDAARIE
jgi:hypothetical protein